ncbi:MAG: hypothetical protein MHM6MM_005394 [Cercozoa sp. M6MM]
MGEQASWSLSGSAFWLRYPILAVLSVVLCGELIAYFFVRLLIYAWETVRFYTRRDFFLQRQLLRAEHFRDWCVTAKRLDEFWRRDRWRDDDDSDLYDADLIRQTQVRLRRARSCCNQQTLRDTLRACFHSVVAASGIHCERLYKETFWGTKRLLCEFVQDVIDASIVLGHSAPPTVQRVIDGATSGSIDLSGPSDDHNDHTDGHGDDGAVFRHARSFMSLLSDDDGDSSDSEHENVRTKRRRSLRDLGQVLARAENEIKATERFFRRARRDFGRTALVLSGGATCAFYHFGVVRALLQNSLLPRVICGTSGGALVSAIICSRTDQELKDEVLRPEFHRFLATSEKWHVKLRRLLTKGHLFDQEDWLRKVEVACGGSYTFEEALHRSGGRVLNITVVASRGRGGHADLVLNYRNAPNVLISSAVIASSALPLCLSSVRLLQKVYHPDGSYTVEPFTDFGRCWSDGSIRIDVPLQHLRNAFNVRHAIVSQTNPHVNLFNFESRGGAGDPTLHKGLLRWRGTGHRGGFVLAACERALKLAMLAQVQLLGEFRLLPPLLGEDWSTTALQETGGNVTVWAKPRVLDVLRLIQDPRESDMRRYLQRGARRTYPKLLRISHRFDLEQALDAAYTAWRKTRSEFEKAVSKLGRNGRLDQGRLRLNEIVADNTDDMSESTDRTLLPDV